jgi:dTDP-4-dehydrorhamnose reductase
MAGLTASLRATTSVAFGARAKRPAFSVLDNANLRRIGLQDLRDWRDALADYLDERKWVRIQM